VIGYFTFEALNISLKTYKSNLEKLNLSNTRLTEKNALDLFETIV